MPSQRPPSLAPPQLPPENREDGRGLRRHGARIGAAVVSALFAAFPPGLRIVRYDAEASLPWTWAVVAGVALVPVAVLIALLASARRGLRTFAGENMSQRAVAAALWVALFFPFLVGFGALLRWTTHHHALAGVTYSLGAVVAGLVLALFANRVGSFLAAAGPIRPIVLLVVLEVLVVTALALRVGTREGNGNGATSSLVVDGLAAILAALLAVRFAAFGRSVLGALGPPLAACLIVLAVTGLRRSPSLRLALAQHAPLYAPFVPAPPPLTPSDPVLSSPDSAPHGAPDP